MLKSPLHSSLLLVSGIVSATLACSSGGTDPGTVVMVPTAGTGSSAGGADSGGTGAVTPTGGNTAVSGSTSGDAGAQPLGGTGGTGVGTGGMGGAAGGAAGGTGGATGGTGGGASGFCGTEVGKVMLGFNDFYAKNGGVNSKNPWTDNGDGTMTVKNGGGDIVSKMGFQNVCLHVEYQAPKFTYPANTDPQQRGNSGVYLKGSWETQVLDTFDLGKTQNDFCGSIYKIAAPLVSACKTGGEWNAYDIEFQANVCTGNMTTTPAKFIKVNLNGMTVHNNVAATVAETQAGMPPVCEARGVLLQDHPTLVPVSFRNIWAIPRP